jgi:hypothetical protein
MVETSGNCLSLVSNDRLVDRYIKWNNNNHSCAILNVDDSSLGSTVRSEFGDIIRNTFDHYLAGFSGFIEGPYDILFAELSAIHKGRLLAKDMNIDELVCYSDSLYCVNLIKGPQVRYHTNVVLIQDKNELPSTPILLSVTHLEKGINVLISSLNLKLLQMPAS